MKLLKLLIRIGLFTAALALTLFIGAMALDRKGAY